MPEPTKPVATATRLCRCGDPDCALESLAYDDLLHDAHKYRGSLRMANKTAKRRGNYIRRIGRWDDFTTWVRAGQPE